MDDLTRAANRALEIAFNDSPRLMENRKRRRTDKYDKARMLSDMREFLKPYISLLMREAGGIAGECAADLLDAIGAIYAYAQASPDIDSIDCTRFLIGIGHYVCEYDTEVKARVCKAIDSKAHVFPYDRIYALQFAVSRADNGYQEISVYLSEISRPLQSALASIAASGISEN